MQHDNNIENKLREMEAMEQSDLSRMDAHWQQMAGMLQPSAVPAKKGWPNWMLNGFYGAAVVILLGAAIWYVVSTKNNRGEDTIAKNQTLTKQNDIETKADSTTGSMHDVSTMALPGSIINDPLTTALASKIKINPALIYDSGWPYKKWTTEDSILAAIKINYTPCDECPDKKNEMTDFGNSRQAKLQNLFGQLEKEEQQFVIDNSKDTLLQFKEGTVLLVPANSFGGMNGIEITAREFYRTSDIVLNQLSTTSNKEQLETGGMLHLSASYKGEDVEIQKNKPVTVVLAPNNNDLKGMQLFLGDHDKKIASSSGKVNWLAGAQYFLRSRIVTEVRVLNLADLPWLIKTSDKKKVGYFMYNEETMTMSKRELKRVLKEKYGYTKIKLTSSIRDRFLPTFGNWKFARNDRRYSGSMGDSLWMEKALADKYELSTNTSIIRQRVVEESSLVNDSAKLISQGRGRVVTENLLDYEPKDLPTGIGVDDAAQAKVANELRSTYSVNLSQLGWINCDRFYSDSRKKVNYTIDLGDTAIHYYTMLVFDRIKSMMAGYIKDNNVTFHNIPIGEPVKIISIGINQKGETVYSVTHTTTSEQELKGLQFQTTSVPDLKASLSKLDN